MLTFADNFLAASLLTLLMPTILLSAIAVWYVRTVRRMPSDMPISAEMPSAETVAAAGDDVHHVTPIGESPQGPAGAEGLGGPAPASTAPDTPAGDNMLPDPQTDDPQGQP